MDPMSLIGSLIQGGMSLLGQDQTNKNNMAMMQQQEAWMTQMSNTAYQRASADMKAAGLNPMMMFGSGGPASSPGAPAAPPRTSGLQALSQSIPNIVSSAVNMKTMDRMTEEIANLITQRKETEARTRLVGQQEKTESERTLLTANESARLGNLLPAYRFEGMSSEQLIQLAKQYPDVFQKVLGTEWLSRHTTSMTDQLGRAVGSALGVHRAGIDAARNRREEDSFESRWGHRAGAF